MMKDTKNIVIDAQDISKSFQVGSQRVPVLKNISFSVDRGDFTIIYGPSGCGKSTLLHTILGLEPPSSGKVIFLGKWLYTNSTEDDRSEFRKKHIGMVYQQPNWIMSLNVIENVSFPLLLIGHTKLNAQKTAFEYLKIVNMENWANYAPLELSSGQQQRIALARALTTNPEIIIADEPTGNLDYESGQYLMELLQDLNKKEDKTILMVTHDLEYLPYAKKAIKMFDGTIESIFNPQTQSQSNIKLKRKNDSI